MTLDISQFEGKDLFEKMGFTYREGRDLSKTTGEYIRIYSLVINSRVIINATWVKNSKRITNKMIIRASEEYNTGYGYDIYYGNVCVITLNRLVELVYEHRFTKVAKIIANDLKRLINLELLKTKI